MKSRKLVDFFKRKKFVGLVVYLKAMAIQLNMFHDCYGLRVNMATTDVVGRRTLVKKTCKIRAQISSWSYLLNKKNNALLFKLNYIV